MGDVGGVRAAFVLGDTVIYENGDADSWEGEWASIPNADTLASFVPLDMGDWLVDKEAARALLTDTSVCTHATFDATGIVTLKIANEAAGRCVTWRGAAPPEVLLLHIFHSCAAHSVPRGAAASEGDGTAASDNPQEGVFNV